MLIDIIRTDLAPSLGVTEPAAIAYAAAAAARAVGGDVTAVRVGLNSGIFKNSFTCAVPGTGGLGCALAAALGAIGGDPEKKLMCLSAAGPCDAAAAEIMVKDGLASVRLLEISSDIRIVVQVDTTLGTAECEIAGAHDNVVRLTVNGSTVFSEETEPSAHTGKVSDHSFSELYAAADIADDLLFLRDAVDTDLRLFKSGQDAGLLRMTSSLVNSSASARDRAVLYACGAIEARVRGASAPAMAITGSGSHGILCMLPIHAAAEADGIPQERELRAILLSCLVTRYIKECSGLLSAVCGCVLAGGTGAACGLTYLYGGTEAQCAMAINSMAASVTGMICHGGNTGCTLKALAGVDAAFASMRMALQNGGAEPVHGILGSTPELTMRNMGRISHGMGDVEGCILDILQNHKG